MVTTLDLYPTIANLAAANIEAQTTIDGRDISSYLQDPDANKLQDEPFYYYARNGNLEAIRSGNWKLHVGKTIGWNKKENGEFPVSLYDLKNDIGETTNLANDFPEIVKELQEMMEEFDGGFTN